MFHTMTQSQQGQRQMLWESMFRDRAAQFVSRHKWGLRVDERGFEVDEFDDVDTRYFISASDDYHLASLRLRPQAAGTMVETHFPDLWEAASDRMVGCHEVTRFCASDALDSSQRIDAIAELLLGLCRHCMHEGIERFHAIVYPSVARLLKMIGWPPEVLAKSRRDGRVVYLCEWVPSEAVCWDIQDNQFDRQLKMATRIPANDGAMAAVA
jgi:acyl homoserine lactone synthase